VTRCPRCSGGRLASDLTALNQGTIALSAALVARRKNNEINALLERVSATRNGLLIHLAQGDDDFSRRVREHAGSIYDVLESQKIEEWKPVNDRSRSLAEECNRLIRSKYDEFIEAATH
jgi:hypothetical protein